MKFIRQGATHKVVLGPAVAVGDGFTPVTTLALSSADEAEAILHDNGTVVDLSGYTWAAITTADGYYHLTLQSGISNTVGHLTVVVNDDSLCLPLREDFMVLEEAIYDGLFAASAARIPADVTAISGDTAAADNLESACDNYSATRGLAGTALPAAAADAAGGLPISDAGGLDLDAQVGTKINDILTDTGTTLQGELDGIQADTEDIQSKIGTPSDLNGGGATLAGNVGDTYTAVVDVNSAIGPGGSNLTGIVWNADWDAEVQSEVQDAIEANHLDHLLAATYDPASKPGAADALLNEIIGSDSGVSQFTANALELAPTGGSAPTVGEIADAVWDEAQADHTTAGTFGIVASEIADILVDTAEIGAAGAGLTEAGGTGDHLTAINLPDQTMNITGDITGSLSGSVGSVTGLTASNLDAAISSRPTLAQMLAGGDVDGYTLEETLKLCLAALAGKLSGAATTTITIRSADDSADRMVATVDSSGNRSAVTLNAAG